MTENNWKTRFTTTEIKFLPADQFLANPDNPRVHPESQRGAVKGSLDTLGWVAPVIVNTRTGYLVDGHERVWQGLKNDNAVVPYIEIDLQPDEEAQFLATFDYITYLANYDRAKLRDLVQGINTTDDNLASLLSSIAQSYNIYTADLAPDAAMHQYTEADIDNGAEALRNKGVFSEKDMKEVMCPHCGGKFYVTE